MSNPRDKGVWPKEYAQDLRRHDIFSAGSLFINDPSALMELDELNLFEKLRNAVNSFDAERIGATNGEDV